jgi:cyclic pyranopterin phosphate synthase
MPRLSHLDARDRVTMVDVGDKPVSRREAVAQGRIRLAPATLALLRQRRLRKGNVLVTAEIAGIQAAKRTADWIPLCHPLPLTRVVVRCELAARGVTVTGTAACRGQTGVEMEALTAVSAALLTIYDMCKAVDKRMVIGPIRLVRKTKTAVSPGEIA